MHHSVVLLFCVLSFPVVSGQIGATFGNGIAGIPICPQGSVVLNYTLTPGATHGVLHHFWATGAQHWIDMIHMEYYIDGEQNASIVFQPSFMCGLAFPTLVNNTYIYQAGELCGKNAPVGGWYNTFPIPFSKSVLVLARSPDTKCLGGYINVRGTENLPVVLPGSGIPLPSTARLSLQKNNWAVRQPQEFIPIASLPAGTKGMMFQTTFAVETAPVGGDQAGGGYIEGCWSFYRQHNESYPGLVVGTGVEDYFDSAYYFGGDSMIHRGLLFSSPLSGLTYFDRSNGIERISAYRFHNADPLVFTDGGSLVWRVGCGPNPDEAQETKCGNPVPTANGPLPPAPPPIPPPPSGNNPSPPPPPVPSSACADGTCDGFCKTQNSKSIQACAATWDGEKNLTAPKTGKKCGGSLGPCDSPADACGEGWEICLSPASKQTPDQFRNIMTAEECANGDPRMWVNGMSHSNPKWEHIPPPCPPNTQNVTNTCLGSGLWGCEPVCCGQECVVPSCPDFLWTKNTRIHIAMGSGCCAELNIVQTKIAGVMCCNTGNSVADVPNNKETVSEPMRSLTPINFTSYGWVYTW
eukprot:m.148378 g.148378  ORF g.148378 m.148378 type:complete len:579 (-) comp14996_c0_seq8:98-1834(-)